MATASNEVLASSVYNPSYAPTVNTLVALMSTDTPSDELLDTYRTTVNSMSTVNPYSGVLYNPRTCDIDSASTDLGDAGQQISDNYNSVITGGNATDVAAWQSAYPQIQADIDQAAASLQDYQDHTDRLIANYPTIASLVQQAIADNVADGSAAGGNPCIGFADIMGSVLSAGSDIINQIMAAVAALKADASADVSAIEDAISKLMAAIAAAITQLQDEVTALANSMLKVNKIGLAQVLNFQSQDPCLKQILASVATSAASSALGSS